MTYRDDIKNVLKIESEDSPASIEKYSRDASLYVVKPTLVVKPANDEEMKSLVKYVTQKKEEKEKISLTARSAGTDMSGGPLTDSIVVDMTAHYNHFLEVGDGYAITEPGVYFRDFDRETKKKGYELPSYTASREICTVGGMVANNSGGEKNLKYGKTARYVESLDVVLADGESHTFRKLEGDALKNKLAEQSYEGELYRKVSELVSKNHDIIEKNKPQVEKNSSGYALWDIGDGVSMLNLARLMVGSQGTLGLITKIRFGLIKPKPYSAMTVMFLKDLQELGSIVPEVLSYQPDSFESYDDHTFQLAAKYFPEFAAQMKTGIIGLGIAFIPELFMLLTGGVPKLVLLAEFRSDSQKDALAQAQKLAAGIRIHSPHVGVRVAKNERAARKYWVIRRESFSLLRKKVRGMRTAPFIDDFVVKPEFLSEFLPKLQDILSKYTLTYTVAGHVGDGNFHIIPLVDPKKPGIRKMIEDLSKEVYDLVLSYKGSISGEHNDGLVRTPYVEQMFGTEMYQLFQKVKDIFDPLNIFNPGKKVGTSLIQSQQHLDLPK